MCLENIKITYTNFTVKEMCLWKPWKSLGGPWGSWKISGGPQFKYRCPRGKTDYDKTCDDH